jgi:predicted nucleic acid-binding protein
MSRIFWDTNLFIYLFEDHGELSGRVVDLRKRMLERNDELCTSTLTLGELLVKPAEAGDVDLTRRYEEAITTTVTLIAFTRETARAYANVRRDRTLRPPDAIQLACAASAAVDLFITNDDRLSHKTVPGIQFVQSLTKTFL